MSNKNYSTRNIGSIDGINYDLDTGEEIDGALVRFPKKRWPYIKWDMINQLEFINLAKFKDITGETFRVLFVLLGSIDYENKVTVSQKWIAEELEISTTQVHRAFKKLIEHKILLKETTKGGLKFYVISENLCWRGKVKNLNKKRQRRQQEDTVTYLA